MNFFKKSWVTIVAIAMLVVSIVLLALNGFTQTEINPLVEKIFSILDIASVGILATKSLLIKKDTANK